MCISKHRAALSKRPEHPGTQCLRGILEPVPCRYRGVPASACICMHFCLLCSYPILQFHAGVFNSRPCLRVWSSFPALCICSFHSLQWKVAASGRCSWIGKAVERWARGGGDLGSCHRGSYKPPSDGRPSRRHW